MPWSTRSTRTLRRAASRSSRSQAVAGEEIGVGDQQASRAWRIACRYSCSMSSLDWPLSRITRRTRAGCPALRRPQRRVVGVRASSSARQAWRISRTTGPLDAHRVVLLGHVAATYQVVLAVIDAADEGLPAIDHHQLAVQPAKQVGAHAEQARARVEQVHANPGGGQPGQVVRAERGGAVAVHRDLHLDTALGGGAEGFLQLPADLVLEDDEGFQEDLPARLGDALEQARKVLFAVDQQFYAVAVAPGEVHGSTSTASGRWSDRCDQGRRERMRGWRPRALRR